MLLAGWYAQSSSALLAWLGIFSVDVPDGVDPAVADDPAAPGVEVDVAVDAGALFGNSAAWTAAIGARPAVKRGRIVNRVSGDPASQLHERHDATDFETKTQDKIGKPA